jgi:hypothetical protein
MFDGGYRVGISSLSPLLAVVIVDYLPKRDLIY